MNWLAVVALVGSPAGTDEASAEAAFSAGVSLRSDAGAARPHFAAAAAAFDSRWNHRDRTPALARNRGRAHFLAGDVPRAVLALREGLAEAPWDAGLRRDLELLRDEVGYPPPSAAGVRLRPDPPAGWRHRVSPPALLAAMVLATLTLAVGLAASLTTRPGWSFPTLVVGAVGLLAATGVTREIIHELWLERQRPVVIVADRRMLRAGNAEVYPARLPDPLPPGAEMTLLGRRGGWVQVETPGGAIGWLPESATLPGPSMSPIRP